MSQIPETEESFAELFEASQKTPAKKKKVQPGEKVKGTVIQVGADRAILDLGGTDAIIELSELAEKGELAKVKTGDVIEAYVARFDDRVAVLAMALGKGMGSRLAIEEAYATGVPVQGVVAAVNKGGYDIEIGGLRCFCPMGQMDTRRIEDPATMVGQHLMFRVAQLKGRDVVLSRRSLMEDEAAGKAIETRKKLSVGARFTGTVTSVRDFGAFVDIGGLEGLVPARELGYGVNRPSDVVHAGQSVEVEVIGIEAADASKPGNKGERLTFSMRALAADPFEDALRELSEGMVLRGTVTRIQPFGAFIELVAGVEGLLHVSAFGKRVAHPSDMVTTGQEIAVRVDSIDGSNRRISLAFVTAEDASALAAAAGIVVEAAPVAAPAPVAAKVIAKIDPANAAGMKMRKGPAKPEVAAPAAKAAPAKGLQVLARGVAAPEKATPEKTERPERPARPPRPAGPSVGDVVDATVDKIEQFGLFVTWAGGGLRGLVPTSELPVPKNADLRKAHPVGSTLRVAVVEVRPDGKVRLSQIAAAQAEERAEAQAWMQTQTPASGKGFGTFGALFAKKMGK